MPDLSPFINANILNVGITIALFVWFIKVLRDERLACDVRERARDEQFAEVIERNTQAIERLRSRS